MSLQKAIGVVWLRSDIAVAFLLSIILLQIKQLLELNLKAIVEILSAILILAGFELFNRRSIKAFYIMAIGQFLAMIICGYTALWFLSFMHFVNFLMHIRGWLKWREDRIISFIKEVI